jgi:hypothetical protein
MSGSFALLDLISQGVAVQRFLKGVPAEQKLAWIGSHGRLHEIVFSTHVPERRPVYCFESRVGLEAKFFIDGDELVFIGDHTTFTASDEK